MNPAIRKFKALDFFSKLFHTPDVRNPDYGKITILELTHLG
jgi:hypothetical protein